MHEDKFDLNNWDSPLFSPGCSGNSSIGFSYFIEIQKNDRHRNILKFRNVPISKELYEKLTSDELPFLYLGRSELKSENESTKSED